MNFSGLKDKFGFNGRLRAEFPSQVIVDITEICNLACIHCAYSDFKNSRHYGARKLDPALNRKMADEVRDKGRGFTQYIRYTSNGEPLVHPEGYEMIAYAARNSGVFVTVTTNGTIMDEQRTGKLLDSGVHMIDISIDAYTQETYKKIRLNGNLDITRANVLRLINQAKKTGYTTKIVVSFIEQPLNIQEAESFRSYWEENGADFVVIRRLHSNSGSSVALAELRRNEIKEEERRPCLYPWERIILNAKGDLKYCPSDWFQSSVLASYKGTTISEVWNGDTLKRLRKAHMTNDFTGHYFCGQCPDWRITRWPHEGRSYADMVAHFKEGSKQ